MVQWLILFCDRFVGRFVAMVVSDESDETPRHRQALEFQKISSRRYPAWLGSV